MPDTTPSNLHDPFTRDELIRAGLIGDSYLIDQITDRLVEQGMCRPRSDMSRMGEWIARRGAAPAIEISYEPIIKVSSDFAATDIGSQIAAQLRGVFAGERA